MYLFIKESKRTILQYSDDVVKHVWSPQRKEEPECILEELGRSVSARFPAYPFYFLIQVSNQLYVLKYICT
jgi:hypothetical protein